MNVRKKINYRFAVCLLVLTAALGGGVHLVHAVQLKRSAVGLLEQADKARDAGTVDKEIEYLYRYLGFVPDNVEALTRLAEQVDERAKKSKTPDGPDRQAAFRYLENAIRRQPENLALRRRQVDTAMSIGRYDVARGHLDQLVPTLAPEAKAERAELESLRGWCLAAVRENPKAVAAFEKAIEQAPERIENYRDLALLYQDRLDQPEKAIATCVRLVKANPERYSAWLQSAILRLRFGVKTQVDLQALSQDVAEARRLAPTEVEVILTAAQVARLQRKPAEARRLLNDGLAQHPTNARLYLPLIALEADENNMDKALALIQQALEKVPSDDERRNDLRFSLAELRLRRGEPREAEELLGELRAAKKFDSVLLDYLQARLFARQELWGKASQQLTEVLPQLIRRRPDLELPTRLLLGHCAQQLGNPDQALSAFQQARKLDPLSAVARSGEATALVSLGRNDEALTLLRESLNTPIPPAGASLAAARLLIERNLRLPPKARNLREIRQLLDRAAGQTPGSPEVTVLRAHVFLLQDSPRIADAQELIDGSIKDHPEQVELWIAKAQLAGLNGKTEDALGVLEEAAKQPKLRDRVELRLARLDYLTVPPAAQGTEAKAVRQKAIDAARRTLTQMEAELATLPPADRPRLLSGLAIVYGRIGDEKETERLWKRIAEVQPNNLTIRLILFDVALLAGADAEARQRVKEIRDIEGKDGVFWRYAEASLRLEQARPKDKEALSAEGRHLLEQARDYLNQAGRQRRTWARIPSLLGELEEMEGHTAEAITAYNQALTLGERRPPIIRKLVQLLYAERRIQEANQVVSNLRGQEATLLQAGLGKLLTEVVLSEGDPLKRDPKHALELALQSVDPDSKSYLDHLWLGRVYASLSKPDKAEESLKRARDLAPHKPETWAALVAFLTERKQTKEAEQIVEQAGRELSKDQRAVTLASCHEILGQPDKAEGDWLEAVKERPNDLTVRHNTANFYLRNNRGAKAIEHLRAIAEASPAPSDAERRWARRNLAIVLANTKRQKDFQEARRLIETNLGEDKKSLPDQHARAVVLATRMSKRKEAIRLFEGLENRGALIAIEHFALIRLYIADGDWEKARLHVRLLEQSPQGTNPEYPEFLARQFIQHAAASSAVERDLSLRDVEGQLEVLRKVLPNASTTCEIEALLLQARGRDADAMARVRRYVAESTEPGRFLLLAAFLSQKHRIDEALERCEEALTNKAGPESVGKIMLAVLRQNKPSKEQFLRVERRLKEFLTQKPSSIALRMYLADLHDYQEDYPTAEKLYLEVLENDPENVLALNNLAWLLAFKKDAGPTGLNAVNRAMGLVGETAELLDTRAVIYMMMGQSREAVNDLLRAVAENRTASRCYHLFQAWTMEGKRSDATKAWRDAQLNGFRPEVHLHPLERKASLPQATK